MTANNNYAVFSITVRLINFKDKRFRGFCRYLLNLEVKYPRNFLHTRSRFLFSMYTWWINH